MKQLNQELTDKKIIEQVLQILRKHLNKDEFKVFLFWSRVKWIVKNNSDFDFGIKWEKPVPFNTFHLIKSEIEEIPALIDLVDFCSVSQEFRDYVGDDVIYLEL